MRQIFHSKFTSAFRFTSISKIANLTIKTGLGICIWIGVGFTASTLVGTSTTTNEAILVFALSTGSSG